MLRVQTDGFANSTIRGNVYEKAHRNRETGLQTVLQLPVSPFFYAHCLHLLLRFCEAPRFASPAPASPDASRDGGQETGEQAKQQAGCRHRCDFCDRPGIDDVRLAMDD